MSFNIRMVQFLYAKVLRDAARDVDTAARLFKEILDWETKDGGQQQPSVQAYAAQYARCLQLKGLTAEAAEIYEKAYPIMLKSYGKHSVPVNNLRTWMEEGKKLDEFKE